MTDAEKMKKHYPEFIDGMRKFKDVFVDIKRDYIKTDISEFGTKPTGTAINPIISDKIKGK